MKDFLIKLLGGYRIVVGYFDDRTGCYTGSMVWVKPFGNHCMRFKNHTLYFNRKGHVEIKPNK
jgi:hypothetical protein